MDYPTAKELAGLNNLTSDWEDKAKLMVGEPTIHSLVRKGWIILFGGYNPDRDRYSITDAGRDARKLGTKPKVRTPSRIRPLAPRIGELPSRLGKPKP